LRRLHQTFPSCVGATNKTIRSGNLYLTDKT
jgi:hypothetical protein